MNNIITKIVIENFRSIKKQQIDCSSMNVFTGLNDAGKSNILKALNLFFTRQTDFLTPLKFDNDFNKIMLAEAQRAGKKKQLIKIKVYVNPPSNYKTLKKEKEVFFEKTWGRLGYYNESFSTTNTKKISRIRLLFNRIKFVYIPALKGTDVLQAFLGQLGNLNLISTNQLEELNKNINSGVAGLNDKLIQSNILFESSFRLPVFLEDFWRSLSVQTKYDRFEQLEDKIEATGKGKKSALNLENYQVPLLLRGDGMRSKFIPALLKWLQSLTHDYYVWGVDEPENSLEFRKAQELSDLFFNVYSQETQIFATSHSLSFVFPQSVQQGSAYIFRCLKGELGDTIVRSFNNPSDLFDGSERIMAAEEIGILEVQKEVIEQFREKTKQLTAIGDELKRVTRPIVFVEGKTDKEILETAYGSLYKRSRGFELIAADTSKKGSDIGAGAQRLNDFLYNHAARVHDTREILGIFDFDEEGANQFNGLLKNGLFDLVENTDQLRVAVHKDHPNIKAMLLPRPPHRTDFTHRDETKYCHLSMELYFEDVELPDANRFYPYNGNTEIFRFKGDKAAFAKKIGNNSAAIDFRHFKPLFQEISSLIK